MSDNLEYLDKMYILFNKEMGENFYHAVVKCIQDIYSKIDNCVNHEPKIGNNPEISSLHKFCKGVCDIYMDSIDKGQQIADQPYWKKLSSRYEKLQNELGCSSEELIEVLDGETKKAMRNIMGQQIADQNNERFGKYRGDNEHCLECGRSVGTLRLSLDHLCEICEAKRRVKDWYSVEKPKTTLTREQVEAVMEKYYPWWSFHREDGMKSEYVLREVLESMIERECCGECGQELKK